MIVEILLGMCALAVAAAGVRACNKSEILEDLVGLIAVLLFYGFLSWFIGFIIMQIRFGG